MVYWDTICSRLTLVRPGVVCVDSFDLRRFTNGNNDFTASTIVPFDEDGPCSIPGRTAFVVARNDSVFNSTFGQASSVEGGVNGPADSNGNSHDIGLHWPCAAASKPCRVLDDPT